MEHQFLLEEYDNPAYDVRTHGVSFHSPYHDSCEGVVGFQLGFTSDENIGEVNDPTPEMKAKIEDFFKQFDIKYTDIKVYCLTYHSY